MTITFENENDIIVYALEKIICYARKHQNIFIAQSVWWIASVIGLADGLTLHIDNLRIHSEANQPLSKDQFNIDTEGVRVHPDRISQIDNKDSEDNIEAENSPDGLERATNIIQDAKRFIGQSRKERKAWKQKPCVLSRTRSGKIPVKPLTKKQRNRLQEIPKDTISAYLSGREN